MDIVCPFKGQCADEGMCCNVCQNNPRRSHFKPDLPEPNPYVPYPQPWPWPPWPNYPQPYIGDVPPWGQTWTCRPVDSRWVNGDELRPGEGQPVYL